MRDASRYVVIVITVRVDSVISGFKGRGERTSCDRARQLRNGRSVLHEPHDTHPMTGRDRRPYRRRCWKPLDPADDYDVSSSPPHALLLRVRIVSPWSIGHVGGCCAATETSEKLAWFSFPLSARRPLWNVVATTNAYFLPLTFYRGRRFSFSLPLSLSSPNPYNACSRRATGRTRITSQAHRSMMY